MLSTGIQPASAPGTGTPGTARRCRTGPRTMACLPADRRGASLSHRPLLMGGIIAAQCFRPCLTSACPSDSTDEATEIGDEHHRLGHLRQLLPVADETPVAGRQD